MAILESPMSDEISSTINVVLSSLTTSNNAIQQTVAEENMVIISLNAKNVIVFKDELLSGSGGTKTTGHV